VEFITYYANQAIKIIEARCNKVGLQRVEKPQEHCVLIEQFFLTACLEYHQHVVNSQFSTVDISYLFADFEDAFDPVRAKGLGFTHLLGGSKRDHGIVERLEHRVRDQFGEYYSRIMAHAADRIVWLPV
jgi:hypothetical protein